MATIVIPFTYSAGGLIVASEQNSNISTIYNDYNGNITNANISASAAIADTKLATITTAGVVNFSALTVGSQAQGDVMYYNGTAWVRLAVGTSSQALTTGGASANPAWAGMTTQGDVEFHNGTTRTRLAPGTSGQFLKTQGAAANPIWDVVSGLSVKVANFTRDLTAATGNVSYTGVGFTPKAVVFIGSNAGASQLAIGVDTLSAQGGIWGPESGVAGQFNSVTSASLRLQTTAGNFQDGKIVTFGADGFTIGWTKNGTPTGTSTIVYLAIS